MLLDAFEKIIVNTMFFFIDAALNHQFKEYIAGIT